jgi:hypothetical protein
LEGINHHKYASDRSPWVLPFEIERLSAHIRESAEEKENALWKYFSLRLTAGSAMMQPSGPDDKADLLLSEVAALRRQIGVLTAVSHREVLQPTETFHDVDKAIATARKSTSIAAILWKANELGLKVWGHEIHKGGELTMKIDPNGANHPLLAQVAALAEAKGVQISMKLIPPRAVSAFTRPESRPGALGESTGQQKGESDRQELSRRQVNPMKDSKRKVFC